MILLFFYFKSILWNPDEEFVNNQGETLDDPGKFFWSQPLHGEIFTETFGETRQLMYFLKSYLYYRGGYEGNYQNTMAKFVLSYGCYCQIRNARYTGVIEGSKD